jgi:hypothetical protein
MSETHETHLDLPWECDHIVERALAGDNTLVQLGCLVLVAIRAAMRSRWISMTISPVHYVLAAISNSIR